MPQSSITPRRPVVVILTVIFFALAIPNSALKLNAFGKAGNMGQSVYWVFVLSLNIALAVWLLWWPRTARWPVIGGFLFKIVGAALAAALAFLGRPTTQVGYPRLASVLFLVAAIALFLLFLHGRKVQAYFHALQSDA